MVSNCFKPCKTVLPSGKFTHIHWIVHKSIHILRILYHFPRPPFSKICFNYLKLNRKLKNWKRLHAFCNDLY
jgi:hypothetical protein